MNENESTYPILTGSHKQAHWAQEQVTWPMLVQRLTWERHTDETAEQWAELKARPGDDTATELKGGAGGWIGGSSIDGSRRRNAMLPRKILALDIDEPAPDFEQRVRSLGCAAVAHQTHTPGHWRVVVPLAEPVDGPGYARLVDDVAARLGGGVDPASRNSAQVMFWPTVPADVAWRPIVVDGRPMGASGRAAAPSTGAELVGALLNAPVGERNDTLNRIAFALAADGRLDGCEEDLRSAAELSGLSPREVDATLRSARGAGERSAEGTRSLFDEVHAPTGEGAVALTERVTGDMFTVEWASEGGPVEEPEELWEGMLPLGALCMFSGQGGVGKSSFDAYLAARVSRGTLPGALEGVPSNVLLVQDEDDWDLDTRPRLMAAGADPSRVARLNVVRDGAVTHVPTLPVDALRLRQLVEEHGFRLVVLDVVTSMMMQGADTNSMADVRRLLNPLHELAQTCGCTVLIVNHWRKANLAANRTSGSSAYRDTARCVWELAQDDDGTRYLHIDKYNRAPVAGAVYEFRMEPVTPVEGWSYSVPRVAGFRPSDRDFADVVAGRESHDPGVDPDVDAAVAVLEQDLEDSGGLMTWAAAKQRAREQGIPVAALRAARKALGMRQVRVTDAGGEHRIRWVLPDAPRIEQDMPEDRVRLMLGAETIEEAVGCSAVAADAQADENERYELWNHGFIEDEKGY